MAKNRYSIDMTTGALLPKIISFTIPLMLTGLLQIVYNAADVMVVGRFAGSLSLAAVGATSSLVHLSLNIFLGLATGSGVVAAKHIGAGNGASVHRTVHTSMLLAVISGIFIAAVGVLLSPFALQAMDIPDDVFPFSVTYLQIFFLGTPASMLYNFGAAMLRATGDSKRPLYILTFSGIINVVLNLIFVIIFKMNVAGVALATIISQFVSAVLVIYILINANSVIHLSVRKLRFYKEELIDIIKIGVPMGIQGSLFSLSNVIIQSSINSFGAAAIAGNTASSNIDSIIHICCNSVSQTATTFTSQNYGAGQIKRIRRIYFNCVGFTVVIAAICCAFLLTFGTQVLGVFSTDPAVIEMGLIRMKLFAVTYVLNSLLDVTTGQMRGLGKSVTPMIVTMAGVCGLRILWVYTVFQAYRSMEVLYLSYPVSWAVTGAVLLVMYAVTFRKIIKRSKENEVTCAG
ncbi:MAG: MATE family efflux transporter [Clostridia bacterium]|nr:MATE family efflux transporter [Clostridia bacterium]MBQ7043279.1 MATE family efflux transporter [Clostridia bacterium]